MHTTLWIGKDLTTLRDVFCGDKLRKQFVVRDALIEYFQAHIEDSPNKEEVRTILGSISKGGEEK